MLNRFWGILTLFFILSASTAFAGDYYSCVRQDNADDWAIAVDLKKSSIALRDNDKWIVGKLVSVLESFPPQYLFEINDRDHHHWEVWFQPTFEETEGTATLNLGGSENIKFNCVAEAQLHDIFKPTRRRNDRTETPSGDRFYCSNVNGVEEWTIYVDLKKKLAGFFDNDTTVVVDLKEVKTLKKRPPETVYIFEGRDTAGGPGEKIRISFNKTRLRGDVTLSNRRGDETRLEADPCIASDRVQIDRERRY